MNKRVAYMSSKHLESDMTTIHEYFQHVDITVKKDIR